MLQIMIFDSSLHDKIEHQRIVNEFLEKRRNSIESVNTNSVFSQSRGGIQLVTIVTYNVDNPPSIPPPLPDVSRLLNKR